MKENKYDDATFFDKYSHMSRSVDGLKGAGEWHELEKILPDFKGKRVLDLGCGFGWHCAYAAEHGAISVVGLDISKKMLEEAKKRNANSNITYLCKPIEEMDDISEGFDVVISSLAFHYIKSFQEICRKTAKCLTKNGAFVFSVEHPVFTAYGNQDWFYDAEGKKLHWPVDRYFEEGKRKAVFLGEEVTKYHRTVTTYIQDLLQSGFEITNIIEPKPEESMLAAIPDMKEELRRPMMLLISAIKK